MRFAILLVALVACADPYFATQEDCIAKYSTRTQIDTCRAAARLPFADASPNSAAAPRDAAGMDEARARAMATAARIWEAGAPRGDR